MDQINSCLMEKRNKNQFVTLLFSCYFRVLCKLLTDWRL